MTAALLTVLTLNGFAKGKDHATSVAKPSVTVLTVERASNKVVYRLVYQSKVEGLVLISIYNEEGDLLLTDKVLNHTGFARPYNFQALPTGQYTLQIVDAQGTITKHIYHGELSVIESTLESPLQVSVQAVENTSKYELRVLGDHTAPLQVTIYDAVGEVIHSEQIDENGSFRKVYDLSSIKASGLTFEVEKDSQVLQAVTF
jgi:hypothetical protein